MRKGGKMRTGNDDKRREDGEMRTGEGYATQQMRTGEKEHENMRRRYEN